MRPTRPLPDIHPEFTVARWPGFVEYRVEHWRLARDGSGKIVRGTTVWSWLDVVALAALVVVLLAQFEIPVPRPSPVYLVGIGVVLTGLLWTRCTQVLHESLLVFPTLGIQLETHRGHPRFPSISSTTRSFIPFSALEDVVIHEGFRRWDVRYYLAVLYRTKTTSRLSVSSFSPSDPSTSTSESESETETETGVGVGDVVPGGAVRVRVAFENVLPHFPVLKAVYLGVQETLFPPPTRVVDADADTDMGGSGTGGD